MTVPEIWLIVSVAFLALAALAGSLAMSRVRGPWDVAVVGARVVAVAFLIVALVASIIVQGQWVAMDPMQAMLSLVVAMLAVHLVLGWRLGAGSAGPVVDIIGLALSLLILFAVKGTAPGLACVPRSPSLQAYWVLFSLGGGSVLVACTVGLTLALRRLLVWRGMVPRLRRQVLLSDLMAQATTLALVALGSGLIISAWWAWRTSGLLADGDPRQVWMAIAWLITAGSYLAWQLDGRRVRWSTGLALAASAAVLVGVLFPVA